MARNIDAATRRSRASWMQFRGVPGAEQTLAPAPLPDDRATPPLERVLAVRSDQERLVAKAETFAHSAPSVCGWPSASPAWIRPLTASGSANLGVGGPLVDANDPKALATVLDVDEEFAERIENAARDLGAISSLADAADRIPARPRPARPRRAASACGSTPSTAVQPCIRAWTSPAPT